MNNILVRMGVVVGVLVAVQLGFVYVFRLTNPTVVPPLKSLETFPAEISTEATGKWQGIKNTDEDERDFNYAQVDSAVSRRYTNRDGRVVLLFLGLYNRPSIGLYHNPFNCYHTHGFTLLESGTRPLKAANRPDTEVSVSTWEKDNKRCVVVYWTEVGDYTMIERQDLLGAQWAMRGKAKWPAMFKVLIEAPGSDPDQAKMDALDMAQSVREWLGTVQPSLD